MPARPERQRSDRQEAQRSRVPARGPDKKTVPARLLAWYDRHARRLPWRAGPGEGPPDPYRVWLSEVMLQQTTVATVGPYFERFLAAWPTVEALAAAPLDDVLVAWAGLGYYARARNLHRCARVLADEFKGRFPEEEADLRGLPGIGAYTAAALAAIAFDRKATVVDGNVERVVARLYAIEAPLPSAKPALRRAAESLTPDRRPGDFAQAMMDLGATVCLPRKPKCMLCPLADDCLGLAQGLAESLPRKSPRAERPTRRAIAFLASSGDGALLLRRRPEKGLLGGMMEVPSTPWEAALPDPGTARNLAPFTADWHTLPGQVSHTFTHFHFEVTVWTAKAGAAEVKALADSGRWVAIDDLADTALPTVMRKIVAHGLKQE